MVGLVTPIGVRLGTRRAGQPGARVLEHQADVEIGVALSNSDHLGAVVRGEVPLRFDVDTAVTAYAKIVRPPFGFLLESVVGGDQWARYTFLGSEPAAAWRLRDGEAEWWTPATGWTPLETDDPLADFDARLKARTPLGAEGLPRLWGGAVGYFSYDVVRRIEHLPGEPEAPS